MFEQYLAIRRLRYSTKQCRLGSYKRLVSLLRTDQLYMSADSYGSCKLEYKLMTVHFTHKMKRSDMFALFATKAKSIQSLPRTPASVNTSLRFACEFSLPALHLCSAQLNANVKKTKFLFYFQIRDSG